MTALSKSIPITSREGAAFNDPVAADAVIYKGAMVGLDASGNLKPAAASGVAVMRGVALEEVDNTGGAAGAKSCQSMTGTFRVAQTGLDRTDIGALVSVTDDATVGGAAALKAGKLVDLDPAGAWVEIG
jgi:hypothetical protein